MVTASFEDYPVNPRTKHNPQGNIQVDCYPLLPRRLRKLPKRLKQDGGFEWICEYLSLSAYRQQQSVFIIGYTPGRSDTNFRAANGSVSNRCVHYGYY